MTTVAEIEGLKELSEKLARLGKDLGGKSLRQAASASVTPVMRQLRAAAPVGSKAHKTYKGRIVAPGFLKRSIAKRTKLDRRKGSAFVTIGVKREAFYGVSFIESGTRNLDPQPWFVRTFETNQQTIESGLKSELKKRIARVAMGPK